MPVCLNCKTELQKKNTEYGQIQFCPDCDSKLIGAANVKRSKINSEIYHHLWASARADYQKKGRNCPTCNQKMSLQYYNEGNEEIEVDICIHCYHFWFDKSEFEELPRVDTVEVTEVVNSKIEHALADYKLKELKERYKMDKNKKGFIRKPDNVWEYIAGIFGFPVEEEGSFFEFYPFITWTFTLLCIVTFFSVAGDLRSYVMQLGFIPSEWFRYFGLTLFTSLIMHGSLWYVVGNMYFLLAFGDNVEDYLGRFKFVLLLLGSHAMGLLLHGFFDPSKNIPLIGASGAVSGVMAFYATMFPKKKIAIVFLFFFRFYKVSMKVWVYFLLWSLIQVLIIFQQVGGRGNVSGLGHLGGIMIGLTVAFYLKLGKKENG